MPFLYYIVFPQSGEPFMFFGNKKRGGGGQSFGCQYLTLLFHFHSLALLSFGWIKVQNNGRSPIELISMHARGRRAIYQLRPYGKEIFRFKGTPSHTFCSLVIRLGTLTICLFVCFAKGKWVLEIAEGNSHDLQVVDFSTSGGDNLHSKLIMQ